MTPNDPPRPPRALATLVSLLATLAAAQPAPPSTETFPLQAGRSIAAARAAIPPVLDGVLDDAVWQQATPITDFHQVDPGEGVPASRPTDVRVAFDAENLYFGARLTHQRRDELAANLMVQAQRVIPDDRLVIVLDPQHDRRNGYHFEVNPHGLRGDALIENNQTAIHEWTTLWYTATRIEDDGSWTVEVRIPLASLSFDPALDTWGLNLFRDMPRVPELVAWSSHGQQEFLTAPAYAGELRGLAGLRKGLGLDVVPSASLHWTKDEVAGTEDLELRPSLDVTYKVGDAATLALTLNTDFTSTEPDTRQVNLSRFSLFYPEKRSFFLQDAGIFEFGHLADNGRPFFSRTIGLAADGTAVDLIGGLKLTGRSDGWSYGLLTVRQDEQTAVDAQTLAVGRLVREVGESSSLGAIVTDGDPQNGGDARTVGFDLRTRDQLFGDAALLTDLWWARSDDGAIGAESDAFGLGVHYPGDVWYASFHAAELQADYRPALGFVNRTDVRTYEWRSRYRMRPAAGTIRAWNYYFNRVWTERIDGGIESDKWTLVPLAPWAPGLGYGELFFDYEREVLTAPFDLFGRIPVPAGDYEGLRSGFWFETSESKTLSGTAEWSTGPFLGGDLDVYAASLTWRASPRFTFETRVRVSDVVLPGGDYTARLLRQSASIALTPKIAWVTLAQYDNVSNDLGVDTRVRYTPQAGEEIAFVYAYGANDFTGDFRTTIQDAVLKALYTFRF